MISHQPPKLAVYHIAKSKGVLCTYVSDCVETRHVFTVSYLKLRGRRHKLYRLPLLAFYACHTVFPVRLR